MKSKIKKLEGKMVLFGGAPPSGFDPIPDIRLM
jgi:hypothetical protein